MFDYEVIVIGGGQGGLTAGYFLSQKNVSYVILDANKNVGDNWANRYDGLTLFTPNSLNKLSGFKLPESSAAYLDKDEFARYLQEYASHHQLNIQSDSKVISLSKSKPGFEVILATGIKLTARQVILATGAFSQPYIPGFSSNIPKSIKQFTPEDIRDFKCRNKKVLVVGDGASGRQLAKLFAPDNEVVLACGRKRYLIPAKFAGLDTFNILKRLGILSFGKESWLGKVLRRRDPFPNTGIDFETLKKAGICLKPKVTDFNSAIVFADNSGFSPDVIIWAMGYRNAYDFVDIPEAFNKAQLFINKGQTEVPGLYTISTPWQVNRASGLIYGVAGDMKRLLPTIIEYQKTSGLAQSSQTSCDTVCG